MLSKCANPNCSAPFHYFREGRIFILDERTWPGLFQKAKEKYGQQSHNVEHFWLCGQCSSQYGIALSREGAISVVPRHVFFGSGNRVAPYTPQSEPRPVIRQKTPAAAAP